MRIMLANSYPESLVLCAGCRALGCYCARLLLFKLKRRVRNLKRLVFGLWRGRGLDFFYKLVLLRQGSRAAAVSEGSEKDVVVRMRVCS